jgi:excisionase family DNA binding protein
MEEQELLSLREAAAQYRIPVPTLRAAVQRGALPGKKIGSQWVVEAQSVENFKNDPPRRGRPSRKDSLTNESRKV